MQLAPRQAVSWSLRTLSIAGPLCLAVPLLWVLGLIPTTDKLLVLMGYLLLLTISATSALGALFGACQFGASRAFAAGLRVGREFGSEDQPPRTLRLVE